MTSQTADLVRLGATSGFVRLPRTGAVSRVRMVAVMFRVRSWLLCILEFLDYVFQRCILQGTDTIQVNVFQIECNIGVCFFFGHDRLRCVL